MNKKGQEGIGGVIFSIFMIILIIIGVSNYLENDTRNEIFESCEIFCTNINQSYVGVKYMETEDKLCMCEEQSYKIVRNGLTNYDVMFSVLNVLNTSEV